MSESIHQSLCPNVSDYEPNVGNLSLERFGQKSAAGTFARNFLLSGGGRADATRQTDTLTTVRTSTLRDLKGANDSLAAELTRQKRKHEKEIVTLRDEAQKARVERDREVAALVRTTENQINNLTAKMNADNKLGQHVINLQKQLGLEQQLRGEAESEVAQAWNKVNGYRRRLEEAEVELTSKGASQDQASLLRSRCHILEDRLDAEEQERCDFKTKTGLCLEEAIGRLKTLTRQEKDASELQQQVTDLRHRLRESREQQNEAEAKAARAQKSASNKSAKLAAQLQTLEERVQDRELGQQASTETIRTAEATMAEQRLRISELESALHTQHRALRDCSEEREIEMEGLQEANRNLTQISDRARQQLAETRLEMEDRAVADSLVIQRLERQVKNAGSLAKQVEASSRKAERLVKEKECQAINSTASRRAKAHADEMVMQLEGEAQRMVLRERELQQKLHLAQEELATVHRKYEDEAEKVRQLVDALTLANASLETEQHKVSEAIRQHTEDGRQNASHVKSMHQTVTALRAEVQALQQAKTDLASRLKLAEAQSERSVGRQRAGDARIQELRAEIVKLSDSLQKEQHNKLQTVQQMSANIKAAETAKLQAQKEARSTRQKLAQAEVRLTETTNLKAKAELKYQKCQASLAAIQRACGTNTAGSSNLQSSPVENKVAADSFVWDELKDDIPVDTLLFHCWSPSSTSEIESED